MTRTEKVINRQAFEMEAWENAFAQYVSSEKGSKEYNQAVRIMLAIDKEFTTELLASEEEVSATTEQTNATQETITAYHGTHEQNLSFTNNRAITNYNHIGTWFTSTPEHASTLYGKHVIQSQLTISNPLYLNTKDFDNMFYIPSIVARHNINNINQVWNNGVYIQELKQYYMSKGYDSIIFQDSTIDLSEGDPSHTVYIILSAENITQSEYMTEVTS